jgi:sugar O-acyltransferase (sialic acid O-acetyltransferase NeuD family)
MAGVSINSGVNVGKHSIINTNSCIDHDCVLNDFVHVSPNAALAGSVTVGEGTHIGISACVIQGIKIGTWATIGAGAVVVDDVPDYAVVVGNPARIIKYNQNNR